MQNLFDQEDKDNIFYHLRFFFIRKFSSLWSFLLNTYYVCGHLVLMERTELQEGWRNIF